MFSNAFAGTEPPAFIKVTGTLSVSKSLKDTAEIKVISPGKEKEDAVFSDSKLKYKGEVKAAPGFFDSLLSWLARKLFGQAGIDNTLLMWKIIIWTMIIISLFIVVRILLRTDLVSLTKQKAKATAFNFTDITEDLDTVNFDQRIAEAFKDADYRLAIRWHYLKMLFLLDKKQLIRFAPHKTNIDYKYELKDKGTQDLFHGLSRIYEYVWYGRFVITETTYALHAENFTGFEKQLNV